MIAEYQKKSNVGVGISLGLWVLAIIMLGPVGQSDIGGVVCICSFISGIPFWYYGCWMYAKAKGYPGAAGLLGLLGIVGLLILLILPDQSKQKTEPVTNPSPEQTPN